MPFYVFKCTECGETYEKLMKIGEKSTQCKVCGSEEPQEQQLTNCTIAFGMMQKKWTSIDQVPPPPGVKP